MTHQTPEARVLSGPPADKRVRYVPIMTYRSTIDSKHFLIKAILEHPGDFEWSLQGFGMMRLYLAPEVRLHVWDSRYRVDGVTDMHTHPWHFHSEVIAGEVVNTRYCQTTLADGSGDHYRQKEILCGVGGHETGREQRVALVRDPPEEIIAGQTYTQLAHEIHSSAPADGTVTIITRAFLDDVDHAFVYAREGSDWVSAEPRPATAQEVKEITQRALEIWFA